MNKFLSTFRCSGTRDFLVLTFALSGLGYFLLLSANPLQHTSIPAFTLMWSPGIAAILCGQRFNVQALGLKKSRFKYYAIAAAVPLSVFVFEYFIEILAGFRSIAIAPELLKKNPSAYLS